MRFIALSTISLLLLGCVSQVKVNNIQASTDYELCGNYKRYTAINIYQSTRSEEIARRNLDCDDERFDDSESIAQAKADKVRQTRVAAKPKFVLQFPKIERPETKPIFNDGHHLKGWSVIYSGKITGFVEKDDFKHSKKNVFKGCDFGRLIILDSQYQVVCKEFSFAYHFNPTAIVVTKDDQLRLLVEGVSYRVGRY